MLSSVNNIKLEINIGNFLTCPGMVPILVGIAGILVNIWRHLNYNQLTSRLGDIKKSKYQSLKNNINKI